MINIDINKCKNCFLCMEVCFPGNFVKGPDGKVAVRDDVTCISCGHCIAACPQGAVTVTGLDAASFEPAADDPQMTYDQLLSLLKRRRSRREFMDRRVEPEKIDKLIHAAAQAPSALNRRTIEYTVITDLDVISSISARSVAFLRQSVRMLKNPFGRLILRLILKSGFNDVLKMLPEMKCVIRSADGGKDPIFYGAPLVLMLHAPSDDTMAHENAAYNTANILLAAETLGLGACIIGFATESASRDAEIKRLAGVPDNHTVHSTVIVGYPKFGYRRAIVRNRAIDKILAMRGKLDIEDKVQELRDAELRE